MRVEMSESVGDTELFSPQAAFVPGLSSQDIWIFFSFIIHYIIQGKKECDQGNKLFMNNAN